MRAERIESSLQPRSWSFNRPAEAPARQLLLLTDGTGEAEVEETRFSLSAPGLLWLGDMKPGRLRAQAGATGFRLWATDAMVLAAVGDQADALTLRHLVERNFALTLAGHDTEAMLLERCCNGVLNELRQPREGSTLMLSGLLRIVMVAMIRVTAGSDVPLSATGEKPSLLRRFRQLVEMNFRGHWTVARYAEALGISTDRLHAICTTGIGKSPKALISERLALEAALRLERSSLTIQQVGHALGFNDPAHFSSFFRRMTGMAPGHYRKTAMASQQEGRNAPTPSFADWP